MWGCAPHNGLPYIILMNINRALPPAGGRAKPYGPAGQINSHQSDVRARRALGPYVRGQRPLTITLCAASDVINRRLRSNLLLFTWGISPGECCGMQLNIASQYSFTCDLLRKSQGTLHL